MLLTRTTYITKKEKNEKEKEKKGFWMVKINSSCKNDSSLLALSLFTTLLDQKPYGYNHRSWYHDKSLYNVGFGYLWKDYTSILYSTSPCYGTCRQFQQKLHILLHVTKSSEASKLNITISVRYIQNLLQMTFEVLKTLFARNYTD